MLHFVALTWDFRSPAQSSAAKELLQDLRRNSPELQRLFATQGMAVFGSPSAKGPSKCLVLPESHGVLLGTVFSGSVPDCAATPISEVPVAESRLILKTGGRRLVQAYWGRYVAFLANADTEEKFILRDPSGDIECLTTTMRDVCIYSSALRYLPLEKLSLSVNWNYVAASLAVCLLDTRETGLVGVGRVLAGECVRTVGSSFSRHCYWNPVEIARSEPVDDPDTAAQLLRSTVVGCVSAWSRCYQDILLRLSGGLDSSIVLACLAALDSGRLPTCVHIHTAADQSSDERQFARLAASNAGAKLVELGVDSHFDARLLLKMPPHHSPYNFLAVVPYNAPGLELARSLGVSAIMNGTGGDEIFFIAGPLYLCADHIFHQGIGMGALTLAADIARRDRTLVWKKLLAEARLAYSSKPLRLLFGDMKPSQLIVSDVAESILAHKLYVPPHLQGLSTRLPPGKIMHIFNLAHSYGMNPAEPFSLPNDSEEVHPLFCQPVKELALRIPTSILAQGGRGRSLARRALGSGVPQAILDRTDKGYAGPFFKSLITNNINFIREILLDGILCRQKIVDQSRLERALGGLSKGYGVENEIGQLFSTEIWLNRHAVRSTRDSEAA